MTPRRKRKEAEEEGKKFLARLAERHHPGQPHHEIVCTYEEWLECQDSVTQQRLAEAWKNAATDAEEEGQQ